PRNDASYDLSRARASVTGPTTIAASTATTSLPNGRIVTALFAGALFLSAFLLFVLEPMVAKSILRRATSVASHRISNCRFTNRAPAGNTQRLVPHSTGATYAR